MPALALAVKPRLRRWRSSVMRPRPASAASAVVSSGSGEASSTTMRRLGRRISASTLSRQASVRAAPPCTATTTSTGGRRRGDARRGFEEIVNATGLAAFSAWRSASGLSGLPSRSWPSPSSTRSGPCIPASAAAGTTKPRGRASNPAASIVASMSDASSVIVPCPRTGRIVRSGSRPGSPGHHAQPASPPSLTATQPAVARIASIAIGLPRKWRPSGDVTRNAFPRRRGAARGPREACGQHGERRMTGSPSADSPHQPGAPASRAIASACPMKAGSTTCRCRARDSASAARVRIAQAPAGGRQTQPGFARRRVRRRGPRTVWTLVYRRARGSPRQA